MEIFLGQWTRRICIGEWLIFFFLQVGMLRVHQRSKRSIDRVRLGKKLSPKQKRVEWELTKVFFFIHVKLDSVMMVLFPGVWCFQETKAARFLLGENTSGHLARLTA